MVILYSYFYDVFAQINALLCLQVCRGASGILHKMYAYLNARYKLPKHKHLSFLSLFFATSQGAHPGQKKRDTFFPGQLISGTKNGTLFPQDNFFFPGIRDNFFPGHFFTGINFFETISLSRNPGQRYPKNNLSREKVIPEKIVPEKGVPVFSPGKTCPKKIVPEIRCPGEKKLPFSSVSLLAAAKIYHKDLNLFK